jgi:hypothetical protein
MPKKGTKSRKGTDDEPKQEEKNKLPEHLEVQRTRVVCKGDAPVNILLLPVEIKRSDNLFFKEPDFS